MNVPFLGHCLPHGKSSDKYVDDNDDAGGKSIRTEVKCFDKGQ